MAKKLKKKSEGPGIEQMTDDIRAAAIGALRNAAKDVLNDLSSISPNWSGDFRASWYVETSDGKRGVKPSGDNGKYNLFNIPMLRIQGRNSRGQFTSKLPANAGKIELFIGNSSQYAQEAMDLVPGGFEYPGFGPEGAVIATGLRQEGIRGKLKGSGRNRITAPLDWYTTYMEGGAFTRAFNRGAKAGFLTPINRPRFNKS
jgi:hypothetical protein